jgi:hypothetical protein
MSNDVYAGRAATIITALLPLLMAAPRTSETSVDIDLTTQQYITEDSELQYSVIKRKENYAVAWL